MKILTSKELLEQQLAEASENTQRHLKGVELSRSTGVDFNAQLQKIVREIRKDINSQLVPLLRKLAPQYQADAAVTDSWVDDLTAALSTLLNKWTSPQFNKVAQDISRQFVNTANDVNRKRFDADMKSFGIDVFSDSPELRDYISASIFDNTRLIKSISDQYLTQVESIVMTNVRAGGRPSAIQTLLRDQFGITENRAKLIARDQTAKVNGDLAAKRQQSSGFQYFQWVDSDDQRVRRRHETIADKVTAYGKGIYRWDNPPLSDRGTPIIPGQDYQCRCIARPVFQKEVDENIKSGNTKPGVKR